MRKLREITQFDAVKYKNFVENLSDDELVVEFKGLKGSHKSQRVLRKKLDIVINDVNRRGVEKIDDRNEEV